MLPVAGSDASAINLDMSPPPDKEMGSSRDLIAEAVELGVDLSAEDAVILVGDDAAKVEPVSSGVDLGAAVVIEEEEPVKGGESGLLLDMFAEPMADADEADAEEVTAEDVVEDDDMAGAALIEDDEDSWGRPPR